VPAPAPQPPALSPNIAMWGDSLTRPVADALSLLMPGRMVFNGGVASQNSRQVSARQIADGPTHNTWINVFWFGHNNQGEPEVIKADLAASVAALAPGNDRFLILGILNRATPAEVRGQPLYHVIMQLNRDLAAQYGSNFFDIRSYLVAQANPALPQDMQDQQNDIVPSSLRIDEIHLTPEGSRLVAARIQELIEARGW